MFKFNGVSANDFGIRVVDEVTHNSANYDIESLTIPGRDGVLVLDNKRLNTVPLTLSIMIDNKHNIPDKVNEIANWLRVKGFQDFEKSWEPDVIYKARFVESLSVTETFRQFGRAVLNFELHPIKYHKSGLTSLKVVKDQTLINNGTSIAKPLIHLTGTGDTLLTINDRKIQFRGIQNHIKWDVEKSLVYHDTLGSQWDKIDALGGNFTEPTLDIGENVINFSGDFTLHITPRWGDVV